MIKSPSFLFLQGTISSQKNEILFSTFNINYERLPAIFKKGTTICWEQIKTSAPDTSSLSNSKTKESEGIDSNSNQETDLSKLSKSQRKAQEKAEKKSFKHVLRTLHVDIIGESFWNSPIRKGEGKIEASSLEDANGELDQLTIEGNGRGKGKEWEDPKRLEGEGVGMNLFDS